MQASKQWPRGIAMSKPVHVVSWGQTTTTLFLCHIEREAMIGVFFTRLIARSDSDKRIFYVVLQKAMTRLHARACLSSWRHDDIIFFKLREAAVLPGSKDSDSTIAKRGDATIKFLYAVKSKDDSSKSGWSCGLQQQAHFSTSYCKKWWRRRLIATMDARSRHATTNTIFFIASRGRKQLAAIAIHDCQLQEQQQLLHFLHHIVTSKQWGLHFLDQSREGEQISSVKINRINQRMIISL